MGVVAETEGMIAGALLPSERRNLLRLIENSKVNQAGLAVRLHSNEGYISNLCKGKAGATLARWRQICGILGAPLTDLFDATPPPRLEPQPLDIVRDLEGQVRLLRQLMEGSGEFMPQQQAGLTEEEVVTAARVGALPPAGATDTRTASDETGTHDGTPERQPRSTNRPRGSHGK